MSLSSILAIGGGLSISVGACCLLVSKSKMEFANKVANMPITSIHQLANKPPISTSVNEDSEQEPNLFKLNCFTSSSSPLEMSLNQAEAVRNGETLSNTLKVAVIENSIIELREEWREQQHQSTQSDGSIVQTKKWDRTLVETEISKNINGNLSFIDQPNTNNLSSNTNSTLYPTLSNNNNGNNPTTTSPSPNPNIIPSASLFLEKENIPSNLYSVQSIRMEPQVNNNTNHNNDSGLSLNLNVNFGSNGYNNNNNNNGGGAPQPRTIGFKYVQKGIPLFQKIFLVGSIKKYSSVNSIYPNISQLDNDSHNNMSMVLDPKDLVVYPGTEVEWLERQKSFSSGLRKTGYFTLTTGIAATTIAIAAQFYK